MDTQSETLLAGRKGLVVGIANEHSIAYGCARIFRALRRRARRDLAQRQGAPARGAAGPRAGGAHRDAPRRRAAGRAGGRVRHGARALGPARLRAALDRVRARGRPARPGRRQLARGLCARDGHLVPFVHAHGPSGRAADGRWRHAADDELPRRRRGGAALRRDGAGEGRARGFGALPRRGTRPARHPRACGLARTDPHACRVRHRLPSTS